MTDETGTTTYTDDSFGQMASATDGAGATVAYTKTHTATW